MHSSFGVLDEDEMLCCPQFPAREVLPSLQASGPLPNLPPTVLHWAPEWSLVPSPRAVTLRRDLLELLGLQGPQEGETLMLHFCSILGGGVGASA